MEGSLDGQKEATEHEAYLGSTELCFGAKGGLGAGFGWP